MVTEENVESAFQKAAGSLIFVGENVSPETDLLYEILLPTLQMKDPKKILAALAQAKKRLAFVTDKLDELQKILTTEGIPPAKAS